MLQDEQVEAAAMGHCLAARRIMTKGNVDVVETFSRANNGRTWVAGRLSSAHIGNQGPETPSAARSASETYMVLPGRSQSIVDCDNEFRRLANDLPWLGI
ncbi:hypothetical protein IE53DRAFT_254034 [Violaceomyces palustris]|uniref:Uncharacterized protein n=1 Tax=Violaceomyces palustris TaxID=1673888 RepID=A0ACD0P3S6_9BASI|nr:hypothetical protein IE53DRAFT_254034 [Violaceomyces palustris]